MKLLHIENSSGQGGSLKSLQALWPAPKCWQVEVVSLERKWSAEISCDYPITNFEKQSVYKAWRYLQRGQFDVLHVNNALIEAWSFVVAAWWEGVPVVSHFRSLRPLRKVEYLLAKCCEKILVLSKKHSQMLPGFVPVEVLYNAIGDKGMGEEVACERIGIFSVLKKGKGHEDVIRALADVEGEWTLEIAGGPVSDQPSTGDELKVLAEELGIQKKINFHGHLSDPFELMKTCSLVVDPSHKAEGFRRTIGEAAMMGRSVLATQVGGAEDLLHADEMVKPGNVEAWRQLLAKHLSSDLNEKVRGLELREEAQKMFDSKKCYEKFWKIISETGSKKR